MSLIKFTLLCVIEYKLYSKLLPFDWPSLASKLVTFRLYFEDEKLHSGRSYLSFLSSASPQLLTSLHQMGTGNLLDSTFLTATLNRNGGWM